jgi:hypothetical protein
MTYTGIMCEFKFGKQNSYNYFLFFFLFWVIKFIDKIAVYGTHNAVLETIAFVVGKD